MHAFRMPTACSIAFACLVVALPARVTAQQMDSAMMKHDAMGNDAMSHDAMGKDAMKAPGGMFAGAKGHTAAGDVTIETVNGAQILTFTKDFALDKAPDAYVVLSGSDMSDAKSLTLGKLKSFTGAQSYVIPVGTDLSAYKNVVLWCRKYAVTLAIAPLASGEMMMHK